MTPACPRSRGLNGPDREAEGRRPGGANVVADAAGMTLPQLAIAFVRAHPAVTFVLIGPRTHEQLDGLLSGADIELSGDILDRIDEIVPPGTDLNPADNYAAAPPAVEHASLRRR
jgi:aryl-alcohol dehydrogenase-like predicted oxidoreductase